MNLEGRIPEDFIEEVRVRTDIVEVISEYIHLKRAGKNYIGLCPFHSEKTPSFTVTPDKQMFYCFGCHTGGHVFSFLMKKENVTYLEAVQQLAERQGLSLPERDLPPQARQAEKKRRRWEEIHEWAAAYFHECLIHRPEGERGRAYFKERGIDSSNAVEYYLGYAPDRWDGLLEAMKARGVKGEELVEAGLALEKNNHSAQGHGFYDRFRNRVIFAILDRRRRPIAFGGRVLDDSVPKYLNSPETAFFSKGHNLYGIHRAHQGIRDIGYALLLEGYMDVIAVQKAGFLNAVASLGTALTKDQAKLLSRYTKRIVIGYDSDAAGVQASLRAGEILQEAGFRVEVLSLKGAKDPDEFIKKFGVNAFRDSLDKVITLVEFKYHTLIRENRPSTIPEKAELIVKLAPDILRIASPSEREGYERFLSLELGLTLEAVQREITLQDKNSLKNKRKTQYYSERQDIYVKNRDNIIRYAKTETPEVNLKIYKAERLLLRLLLEDETFIIKVKERLGEDFWKLPDHQDVFNYISQKKLKEELKGLNYEDGVQTALASLYLEDIDLSHPHQLFEDCIEGILSVQTKESIEDLQTRMRELEKSGDMAAAMVLLREIGERLKRGEK